MGKYLFYKSFVQCLADFLFVRTKVICPARCDWYDIAVEAMLNQALKDKGTEKRFIQIFTGNQTVFALYATSGQVKLISNKFGLPTNEDIEAMNGKPVVSLLDYINLA